VDKNNERLEYLGDAVLELIVSDYLFAKFPYKSEGFLTEMRSKIVSRNQLGNIAIKMGLTNFLQHRMGNRLNVNRSSILGNTLEALIGALYIDLGYKKTKRIVLNKILKIYIDIEALESMELNFKSRLLEWGQKFSKTIRFELIGKKHKKYIVVVVIDEKEIAQAENYNKRNAEKMAAEKACRLLDI